MFHLILGWLTPILVTYARDTITSGLRSAVGRGSLLLEEDSRREVIGERLEKPTALLFVRDETFWLRFYLKGDLGIAESYINGEFETPNLEALLQLWMDNHERAERQSTIPTLIRYCSSALYLRLFGQTLNMARKNAITGYDGAPAIYSALLSKDQTYSSALWPTHLGGPRGDLLSPERTLGDLESAQLEKINYILDQARVKAGSRLLEFGSGWGALAIEAARRGADVDTLTLSVEQQAGAQARIKALGLQGRIRVHLLDYRQTPTIFTKGSFDAFVAVEMIEAVGVRYLPRFFEILDWALKPQAAAVMVATCQPENRFTVLQANDYARVFQWPNSFCFSATYLLNVVEKTTRGSLVTESIDNWSHHYPRTLREWNYRLQANWNSNTIAAILRDRPELADGDRLGQLKRNFEYMCAYAAVGFANAYCHLMVFTFTRPEFVKIKSN